MEIPARKLIRVLLVDDSPLAITCIRRMLEPEEDIQIVAVANHGEQALQLLEEHNPDIILTDLHMPKMDGFQLTQEVMHHKPKPILVISISVHEGEDAANIFRLLDAGAMDVFPKPKGGLVSPQDPLARELAKKVRVLSGVVPFRKRKKPEPPSLLRPGSPNFGQSTQPSLVALGASTGGPSVLQQILGQLPKDFPLPIVCIQHISLGFLDGLVQWLGKCLALPCHIARAGDRPLPGHVYFPPEDRHLLLDEQGCFQTSSLAPLKGHRPSITVTFQSLAARLGARVLGVLLTGMGDDGAAGLKSIREKGGLCLAQSEESCLIFGMPQKAEALGAVDRLLHPDEIAQTILAAAKRGENL